MYIPYQLINQNYCSTKYMKYCKFYIYQLIEFDKSTQSKRAELFLQDRITNRFMQN